MVVVHARAGIRALQLSRCRTGIGIAVGIAGSVPPAGQRRVRGTLPRRRDGVPVAPPREIAGCRYRFRLASTAKRDLGRSSPARCQTDGRRGRERIPTRCLLDLSDRRATRVASRWRKRVTLLLSAWTIGLILSLLALGVYISYRVFKFADITADGSITFGAAVAASMLTHGRHPLAASGAAFVSGALAGMCTGILHTRFKINQLLSGILVMTALYS